MRAQHGTCRRGSRRVEAEIRIGGALQLFDSVLQELEHAYNRVSAGPKEKAQMLAIQRMLAEAIPPERRFERPQPRVVRGRSLNRSESRR